MPRARRADPIKVRVVGSGTVLVECWVATKLMVVEPCASGNTAPASKVVLTDTKLAPPVKVAPAMAAEEPKERGAVVPTKSSFGVALVRVEPLVVDQVKLKPFRVPVWESLQLPMAWI